MKHEDFPWQDDAAAHMGCPVKVCIHRGYVLHHWGYGYCAVPIEAPPGYLLGGESHNTCSAYPNDGAQTTCHYERELQRLLEWMDCTGDCVVLAADGQTILERL